jgi:hypothetical protein
MTFLVLNKRFETPVTHAEELEIGKNLLTSFSMKLKAVRDEPR